MLFWFFLRIDSNESDRWNSHVSVFKTLTFVLAHNPVFYSSLRDGLTCAAGYNILTHLFHIESYCLLSPSCTAYFPCYRIIFCVSALVSEAVNEHATRHTSIGVCLVSVLQETQWLGDCAWGLIHTWYSWHICHTYISVWESIKCEGEYESINMSWTGAQKSLQYCLAHVHHMFKGIRFLFHIIFLYLLEGIIVPVAVTSAAQSVNWPRYQVFTHLPKWVIFVHSDLHAHPILVSTTGHQPPALCYECWHYSII